MKTSHLPILLLLLLLPSCSCGGTAEGDHGGEARVFHPGDVIPESYLENQGCEGFFTCGEIPDSIFSFMQGKSYKKDCPVPRESLRYMTILHKDMLKRSILGEMVVSSEISSDLTDIFKRLYEEEYPVERMVLVDNYDADDEKSMEDNNSSSFNFRFISHTTTVSKHGLGMAVDINPLYNPYHKFLSDGGESVEPAGGKPYLDRSREFPYKIVKGDLCYNLFVEHGFQWGGDWISCKDYQHFEK